MEEVEQIIEKLTEDWNYNKMSLINKLFNYYKVNVDGNADLNELAKSYGISNLQSMKINDRNKRLELIEFLYDSIKDKLAHSLPPPPPTILPTALYQPPPKIDESKPLNLSDISLKHIDTSYIDAQLEQARKEYKEAEQRFEYLQQLKETIKNEKLLVQQRQNAFTEQIKKESDLIRENYDYKVSNSKKPISYNEYLEQLKKQNLMIPSLIKYLNENRDEYEIDFSKFDLTGKTKLNESLVNWFENKIGNLYRKDHYRINYHVGDIWKSAPLNKDTYLKLLNNLKEGHLLYNLDETPTWTYEAGAEPTNNLPEWSLFDYISIVKSFKHKSTYSDNGGHFFEYLNNSPQFKRVNEYFKRFQIFDKLSLNGKSQREELDDCCFIYAVKQTGKFTEEQLNLMRMRIKSRYLSAGKINEIATEFKFKVILRRINEEDRTRQIKAKNNYFIGYEDASPEMTFEFDLFENHWMIHIDKTEFTSDYIKYIDEAPEDAFNKRRRMKNGKIIWEKTNEISRFISSSDLVREWFKQNKFTPITYATASILKTTLYENIKDNDYPLEFDEESCLKLICAFNSAELPKDKAFAIGKIEEKKKINKSQSNPSNPSPPPSYFYADFEADVSQDIHKPFMCVVQSADGISTTFKGPNCAKQFLNFLPDNAVCYFHNFAYDWCMFNKLASSIQKVIKKGSKVYQAKILFYKKRLTFKDSLAIFMCKLSDLPKAFKLEGIKKELFPYKYYTLNRLQSNVGIINEAGEKEDKRWSDDDYKEFKENIDSIGARIDENTFDMYKYAEFYCQQDVRILREAFEKLCDGFMKEFQIDVKTILTTPALANKFFSREVYEKNGNLYEVGGHVREFMSKAIYGGRCMTAYNKKWHTVKNICDYDAVSLYPSAMRRLWTVEGKPEVLMVPNINEIHSSMPEYLQKYATSSGIGAFIVEIKIITVHKHYAFPLIVQKTKDGNRNDDQGIDKNHPVFMTVDNIMLEDLIEFQQIEFQVIKGYVWNGKRDYTIQEVIQKVFDSRLKYKAEKNPLEQLYKLILNSSYGKTIQKPVDFDLKFVSKWVKPGETISKYERFYEKNYNKIIEVPYENDDMAIIKVRTQIDKHFNFSLLGIQVLSMSKRIMNQVMCLGFDIGCHIYYQDTDSFMIERDDLPRLEEAFEKKYNRPLRGKTMGCFHNDFPTINGHDEVPHSIEAYFIMKKVYIHRITDSTGDIDYVIRGKGITQQSIKYAAGRKGGFMNLYRALFQGNEVSFDLTDGQPSFDMRNDFTVSTRKKFERRIKTHYKLGKSDKYFEYAKN